MITVTDLFAGAGGSSTGAIAVPGVQIRVAANHWRQAVDVHNANHPDADHICADISQYDPRAFPTTTILWASPECTNHTIAKGISEGSRRPDLFEQGLPDEAAERSRATMWDVPRFAEVHRYRAVIVENVVEAAKWQPFRAWLLAMHSLGYEHRIVYLNSMHATRYGMPAPQSRDRIYVVFWRTGDKAPDLEGMQRPTAWCPTCQADVPAMQAWKRPERAWGRYRAQYVYRCPNVTCRNQIVEPYWLPAAAAIDWTLPGTRVGDRKKPLSEKTRARIAAGIARYWRPFTLEAAGNTFERRPGVRTRDIADVMTTLHGTASKALAVPVEGRDGKAAQLATDPLRTMTTRNETGLLMPFITERRGDRPTTRPTGDPYSTFATVAQHALVRAPGDTAPFIAELRGGGSTARTVREPLATFAASGTHHGLVMRNNSATRGDGAYLTTPTSEPLRALTASGNQSLLEPPSIDVDDCLFRMLEPSEIAAGMAFPDSYIWEGTRRTRVRMAGNAVTPPAARDLVGTVAEALA